MPCLMDRIKEYINQCKSLSQKAIDDVKVVSDNLVLAEQTITDMDIAQIETEIALTDMELRLIEVEGRINE